MDSLRFLIYQSWPIKAFNRPSLDLPMVFYGRPTRPLQEAFIFRSTIVSPGTKGRKECAIFKRENKQPEKIKIILHLTTPDNSTTNQQHNTNNTHPGNNLKHQPPPLPQFITSPYFYKVTWHLYNISAFYYYWKLDILILVIAVTLQSHIVFWYGVTITCYPIVSNRTTTNNSTTNQLLIINYSHPTT
jgi:hypothetical protein